MKKIIPLSVLLLVSVLMYASDTTQVKKPFKRLYIGASFTPEVTYRYINQNYIPAGVTAAEEKMVRDLRNKQEKPQMGFGAGVRLGVNATRFMSIETGVDYNLHRYLYKIDSITLGSQWNGNGYDTSINYTGKETFSYHYLTIPVALNFSLGKHKLKGIISAGADFSFLLRKKNNMRIYEGNNMIYSTTATDHYPFNTFNISPFLGVGIEWHLTKFLFLRVMPIAHMQVLKNIDAPITERLWRVGLNAAVYIGFVKVKS